MKDLITKNLYFIKHYKHGGNLLLYKNISPNLKIYDFSVNLNPLGPPEWLRVIINANWEKIYQYPEPYAESLIETISQSLEINNNHLLITNGINSIITILGKILQEKYHINHLILPVPNYIEYEEKFHFLNYKIKFFLPEEEVLTNSLFDKRFIWDLDKLKENIQPNTLIIFTNPNNPTGSWIDSKELATLISYYPDCFFIIDESFIDFTNEDSIIKHLSNFNNTIIFRSFTKFYHIPGIRLGYVISNPILIKELRPYINCWNINSFAIEIGKKAIQDREYRYNSLKYLHEQKYNLIQQLKKIPQFNIYESCTNYLLLKINDKDWNAIKLFEKLLKEYSISIRICHNYQGLDPQYFRIAIKSKEENQILVNALFNIFLNKSIYIKKEKKYSLMITGTSSDAGKSLITTALCRILYQDGFKVAPFKAQNMSLNSYVTPQGEEIAYAQYLQARACKILPDSRMNPILIKPGTLNGSQIIIRGKPFKYFTPLEYYQHKNQFFKDVQNSYKELQKEYDVIILEGAGSISEINLKKNDLVNLNMAQFAKSPVLITGDIDRGGVFASFIGSIEVLNHWEKDLIKGFIINKFRGEEKLLKPAIDYLEERTNIPYLGTIPYIKDLNIPKEDSMFFEIIHNHSIQCLDPTKINIGIIQLPSISNFTDYDPFLIEPDVQLYWIKNYIPDNIDVIIIPGTRNTFYDLLYLKEKHLDKQIIKHKDKFIIGICGGLQILGISICDRNEIEYKGSLNGLGLLQIKTEFLKEKELSYIRAFHCELESEIMGYEIHHGKTDWGKEKVILKKDNKIIGVSNHNGNIWGTYLHGIFENNYFRRWFLNQVRKKKGLNPIEQIFYYDIDKEIDRLADILREHLNINKIYNIMGII
ncbi:MAG: adenosylcobalamin biosynthesis bifunctional protein CobDQ [Leptospiraceae bacterium]|nr:MAG: adenosylcobalamin biosynthesis bifunctional protein CobDQ [Leptospiraceae bacterium]